MRKFKLIKEYPGSPKLGSITSSLKTDLCDEWYIVNGNIRLDPDEVEKYPEFWEKVVEKDYKILSFKQNSDIGNLWESVDITCEKFARKSGQMFCTKPYNLEDILNNPLYSIHSVKRLSDSEVFTVGDKVSAENSNYGEITKFELKFKKIYISTKNGNNRCCLNDLLPNKKPLFTTDFEIISWLSNNKLESINDKEVYFDSKFDIIQSVKRKSDNVQFKIGERIKEGFITKIIIKKDKIYLKV